MSDEVQRVYAAIGEVVVRFQELEAGVGTLAMELGGIDQAVGLCISSEASFPRLVAALCSIAKLRLTDAALLARVDEVAKQCSAAEQKRNAILHSIYGMGGEKLLRIRITAKQRKGLEAVLRHADVNEMQQAVTELENAKQAVAKLAAEFKSRGLITDRFFR